MFKRESHLESHLELHLELHSLAADSVKKWLIRWISVIIAILCQTKFRAMLRTKRRLCSGYISERKLCQWIRQLY